jgi:hypothetical protein
MCIKLSHKVPPSPTPTRALPGTPEKVAVLRERARLGQSLWHPLDAVLDSTAETVSEELVDALLEVA